MGAMNDKRVINLFRRHQMKPIDIKYILHVQQRSVLYLLDGREITSSLPLKTIYANLPEREFWSIQKGVVVSVQHTICIDAENIYTMVDGKKFKGRSRNPAEHKRRAQMLNLPGVPTAAQGPISLLQQCALMERAPVPFCIIELIFTCDGHSVDFVFRYCNPQMEVMEDVPSDQMIGRSFYEVFPVRDRKWIVPAADVALNGTSRKLSNLTNEKGETQTIYCYQPQPGYCACIFTKE